MKEAKFQKKVEALLEEVLNVCNDQNMQVIMTALSITYVEMFKECMDAGDEGLKQHAEQMSQVMLSKLFEQRTGMTIDDAKVMLEKSMAESVDATIN